jgi:hypothetical protein
MYERTVRSEIERRLNKAHDGYVAYAEKVRSLPMGEDGTQQRADYTSAWIFQERMNERWHTLKQVLDLIDGAYAWQERD